MSYSDVLPWLLLLCAGGFAISLARSRDILHPGCLISLFFLGTLGGALLALGDSLEGLDQRTDSERDTFIYLVGIASMIIGANLGDRNTNWRRQRAPPLALDSRTARRAAYFLGAIALALYALEVQSGGGFLAVYTQVKGRGDLGSGIADFIFLSVPATALYFYSLGGKRPTLGDCVVIGVLLLPLLIPGVLASRRGPMAIALSVPFFAYFLTRNTRPPFLVLVSAGALGALILAFLVSFRGDIYLGSNAFEELTPTAAWERIVAYNSHELPSSELVYGSNVMDSAVSQDDFWWGRRYLASLTIWLVPSFIVDDKYNLFDVGGMLRNGGTLGNEDAGEFAVTLGAAPMLIADSFVEFSFAYFVFLFLLGMAGGWLWRKAVTQGDQYVLIYIAVLSVSVFLFAQGFTAFAQRAFIMTVPSLLLFGPLFARRKPGAQRRR